MNSSKQGIIFTDFDGTLFNHRRFITEENYAALTAARKAGYITAIATGRSLFSFRRVAESLDRPIEDFFDYLIFSSGAGVIRSFYGIRGFDTYIKEADLIESESLDSSNAYEAAGLLFRRGIDFMIHKPAPENHRFVHIKSNGAVNPDYYRRIKIYYDFAQPLEPDDDDSDLDRIKKLCFEGVSQLVAVIPPSEISDNEKYYHELYEYISHRLSECSVVRTSSPIDHKSLWIEIFSPQVSKSRTAERLAVSLGFGASDCLAIGNDFNDEDLLKWAGTSRTVDEAPDRLKQLYPSAGSSLDGAVASAINSFIDRKILEKL